jgi:hypothetical protein
MPQLKGAREEGRAEGFRLRMVLRWRGLEGQRKKGAQTEDGT